MKKIAIFASGSGTNAQNIATYFKSHTEIEVALILSNRKDAFVLERARELGIPSVVFSREEFKNPEGILNLLKSKNIDLIVLAGFLWLIPRLLIKEYPQRIINIHPALLPKYGGKNMYGTKVHQAVIESGDKESGITIHFVDEIYDNGKIIFQVKCAISEEDTPITLAEKIHALEYRHFPEEIERLLEL